MGRLTRSHLLAVAVAAGIGFATSAASAADTYRFMTGPQGGAWIPLGGALKGLWEKAVPGMQIQTTPGAGISNVRGIDEGKAQIGMANSSTTYDGIAGNKPYPKKVTKVCQLANLYPQYFQVVALADALDWSIGDVAQTVAKADVLSSFYFNIVDPNTGIRPTLTYMSGSGQAYEVRAAGSDAAVSAPAPASTAPRRPSVASYSTARRYSRS